MRPNQQETADLVNLLRKSLLENLNFCAANNQQEFYLSISGCCLKTKPRQFFRDDINDKNCFLHLH